MEPSSCEDHQDAFGIFGVFFTLHYQISFAVIVLRYRLYFCAGVMEDKMNLDSRHSPSHDRENSPFNDDWECFTGVHGQSSKEELYTLARSDKQTFIALSMVGSGCWEDI
ncbi:unnamed protein product [Vicia faba]|uniref:Uncharacterized protein n=1 Tax=Vicia faba TaxID=3906 RepID=A0AAV1ABE5_VICFA|nr:unnamed protein product [Vicia faba]